jgi:hypothetical protein
MENIPQPNYEIFIRNRNFDIEGVVTRYSKLEFRIVYNGIGGWMLEMESNTAAAKTMKKLFRDEVGAYTGIIVTRDSKIVYSGITRGFEQTGEYMDQADQENITFFGIEDNGLLSMRLIMVPRIGSNPQEFISPSNQNWGVWRYPDTDDEPRHLSSVIYTTVADNISFSAPVSRQIPLLYIKKPDSFGPVTVMRGRYQNLLEKCQEISYFPGDQAYQTATPYYTGMQFRTIQLPKPIYVYNENAPEDIINTPVPPNLLPPFTPAPPANTQIKKVYFALIRPLDKTQSVVFSKGIKNLGSFRYKLTAPQATHIVLGGQNNTSTLNNPNHTPNPITLQDGDPRTRWFAHTAANSGKFDLVSQYGLWESFLDKRDIQYGQAPQSPAGTPAPEVVQDPYPRLPDDPYNPEPVAAKAIQNYNDMRAEMTQAMQTELIEKRELLEIEITTVNIKPTIWSIDYNVGDIVTVVIPGEENKPIYAKVREVTVTLTQDRGEVVNIVVGTETQPNGRDIFSKIVRVNKKANSLEELR